MHFIDCNQAELVIILDASGSIEANFDAMKSFVKALIGRFTIGSNAVRVSLVRFSQTASPVWGLSRYNSAFELERAVDGVQLIRGRTNIAAGIRVWLIYHNIIFWSETAYITLILDCF